MSRRIAMVLEFDGHDFSGWQRQRNASSIQQHLEDALQAVDQRSPEQLQLVAAGRTDAGVHACAMLVHANVAAHRWQRAPRAYLHGVNARLPETIRVIGVQGVADNFHARFDCLERAYCYQIWNRSTLSALHRWRHWWMPRPLDIEAMRAAAHLTVGKRDFSALRASGCQAHSPVRHVREVTIEQRDDCIRIHVRADAFLYHMVRNLVGNLVEVGLGKNSVQGFAHLLEQGDRRLGAATAPAQGLFFTDAVYADFRATELIGLAGEPA